MESITQRAPHQPLVAAGQMDHHVNDMTVTFAADLTLAELQFALAAHGQWLPIDGDPDVQIGQLVLCNSTGPLRLGYGAWRDLLLGAQFTNGRGALITVGGRVLKNVAGYDVTKLLVGSYGIFGTPVTFTARTWQRPAAALHVGLSPDVLPKLTSILASPLKPYWAVLTGAGVQFGYHGDDAAIVYYEARIGALEPARVQRVSIDRDDAARLTLWNRSVGFRASVPPANLAAFVRDAKLENFVADAVFGVVHCSQQSGFDVDLFRETAKRHRATLVEFDDRGMPRTLNLEPATCAILQKLKTAFDPDATLAPLPKNTP